MEGQAIWLTLRLAATTTTILLALAVPLAWWIASGRGATRSIVQSFVALPLVLPPTVIGFYLLTGFGPLTVVGRWVTLALGHPLAFSFAGLLLGSLVYSLPFAVQPLVAGFRSIEKDYVEAAAGLGIGPARTFLRVVLPMAQSSVLTAAVLAFTHTVGEFGVVLMLGGNIPGATQTLSIVLYDRVQDGDYAAANKLALLLCALSFLALLVIYARSSRGIRQGQNVF